MPEWLYEAGIGENRAALIEDGVIVEAVVEVEAGGPRVGAVADGRLIAIAVPGRRGVVALADGSELLVEPLGPGWCEGGTVRIEVTRETIVERTVTKRAKGRPSNAPVAPGQDLATRLANGIVPVRPLQSYGDDALEAAGWSELIEAAQSGVWGFAGGTLRIESTAAMTVIDIDGHLEPGALALAAADAAARAIRCFGIAGSIAIDFPTLGDKMERAAVATRFDAGLPKSFERTALNGFGLMQVIRPRLRPSLIERLQRDPVGHAARALLRTAQRSGRTGSVRLAAAPGVIATLAVRPDWLQQLGRELGGDVALRPDPALAISAAYVEPA